MMPHHVEHIRFAKGHLQEQMDRPLSFSIWRYCIHSWEVTSRASVSLAGENYHESLIHESVERHPCIENRPRALVRSSDCAEAHFWVFDTTLVTVVNERDMLIVIRHGEITARGKRSMVRSKVERAGHSQSSFRLLWVGRDQTMNGLSRDRGIITKPGYQDWSPIFDWLIMFLFFCSHFVCQSPRKNGSRLEVMSGTIL